MRRVLWGVLRNVLFRMDAETAHRLTNSLIRLSLRLKNVPLRIVAGPVSSERPGASVSVFGMDFAAAVGLAAGFDKNGEILAALPTLGFGFAEVGTVTPRPQPGNDRPRLFRDPKTGSLFNRMGFNNLGATLVSARLAHARPLLPRGFRVGVNIGKNKDTPLEKSYEDYANAIRPFRDLADYVVINVSSPNTPGLRSLQTVEALDPIVSHVGEVLSGWTRTPPLLLKLAPEVRGVELESLITALESKGVAGWVLTNTLAGEFETSAGRLSGGWSGGAVAESARESLRGVRAITKLPIISVGGILSAQEARRRMEMGANLVQIYTGWVYGGPSFPQEIKKALISR